MPYRPEARYPAGFQEVISVGAVDQYDNITSYSDYPALPPHHNGIVTYGGGLAPPLFPPQQDINLPPHPLHLPRDFATQTPATNPAPPRGNYTPPLFPPLPALLAPPLYTL